MICFELRPLWKFPAKKCRQGSTLGGHFGLKLLYDLAEFQSIFLLFNILSDEKRIFQFRSKLRAWQCRPTVYKIAAVTSSRWVFQKLKIMSLANVCPTSNSEFRWNPSIRLGARASTDRHRQTDTDGQTGSLHIRCLDIQSFWNDWIWKGQVLYQNPWKRLIWSCSYKPDKLPACPDEALILSNHGLRTRSKFGWIQIHKFWLVITQDSNCFHIKKSYQLSFEIKLYCPQNSCIAHVKLLQQSTVMSFIF